jgi:hypothetical protein
MATQGHLVQILILPVYIVKMSSSSFSIPFPWSFCNRVQDNYGAF